MKKLKQILAVVVLVFCCSMIVKADTKAEETFKITGLKQVDDYIDGVILSCDYAQDGYTQFYYVELSATPSNNDDDWKYVASTIDPKKIIIPDLNAGQSYYVRVRGVRVENEKIYETSEPSEPLEVVTTPQVSNITAAQSGASTNGVTVKITATASGANYYVLSYNNQIIGKSTSPNVTTSALKPGSRYTNVTADACRVANAGKDTEYIAFPSKYYKLTVTTLQPKINKSNFGISGGDLKKGSYTLAVNSVYAADGYHFEFQPVSGKGKKNFYAKGTPSVGVSGLNGTFYTYRVRSYVNCASGPVYGAWSDVKTFAVVKNVKAKLKKGNKVQLSWKKVSGASGYTIYASTKEKSGYKKVKSLNAKKTSLTISKVKGSKLKKNKTYYFRIVPKAKKAGNADFYYIYSGKIVTQYR